MANVTHYEEGPYVCPACGGTKVCIACKGKGVAGFFNKHVCYECEGSKICPICERTNQEK